MKTTEFTDIDGDALTITQRLDATWITCTKGAEEVTIGPVPTDAVRHAFQEPMGGDDMDGGVTAAAIENEVVSPGRARSLVQERDELAEALDTTMGRAIKAERERDEAARFAALWKEAARREFQYRVLARSGREFYRGIARKFEESRDAAVQERGDAIARAESARELFHGANLKIVAWRERAERAEQERDNKAAAYDQLKVLFGSAERAAIRWKARAEQGRALTAEEVPDAMVLPMLEALGSREKGKRVAQHPALLVSRIRHGLAAALNVDPARPEGAEGLDEWLRQANHAALGGSLDADQRRTLADHLAGLGVRAGGDR